MANVTAEQPKPQIPLSFWNHLAIFLLAMIIIVTRRPDALFHAQFWAEDGSVFYANAYNFEWWQTLFLPHLGYIQVVPRLAAALALLAPLSLAPLILNIIAIFFQALPVSLLLSDRSSRWGALRFRVLCAAVYLALPNCDEVGSNITNSQWMLALCAFFVLVASAPRGVAGRIFDVLLLLLCGLTGPFCIFLLPLALFLAIGKRESWIWVRSSLLAATFLAQIYALADRGLASRPHGLLGASVALLVRLIAYHVYLGTLLGNNYIAAHTGSAAAGSAMALPIVLIAVAIGGTLMIAICFVKSGVEMRLLVLLSAMVLASSLIFPTAYPSAGVSAWEMLEAAGPIRYWFLPTLVFAWSLLWCLRTGGRGLRIVSACLLVAMCYGIWVDWHHPAFEDLHFADNVKRFEDAPAGTTVVIPLNPVAWHMTLVKRTPRK